MKVKLNAGYFFYVKYTWNNCKYFKMFDISFHSSWLPFWDIFFQTVCKQFILFWSINEFYFSLLILRLKVNIVIYSLVLQYMYKSYATKKCLGKRVCLWIYLTCDTWSPFTIWLYTFHVNILYFGFGSRIDPGR